MGGDPKAPQTQESMRQILQSFQDGIPGVIKTITPASILANRQLENSKLDIAKKTTNAYQNIQADAINGGGRRIAENSLALDKDINPEFYKTRALQEGKFKELLNSINVDPSSTHEAERLINSENHRSGNANVASGTSAIRNAIQFGDERMKRQNMLGNALGQATSFLQPSKTNIDPYGNASVINKSDGQGYNASVGMGNGVLGAASAANQQQNLINSQRRDTLDRVNETMSSL